MEKVKLPKEICDLLDKGFEYYKEDGNNQLLWSALQSPYIDNEHILKKLRIFSNQKENATLIAKAILYGYEPEETEEERKERDIKQKMLDFINDSSNKFMLNTDYVDFLYDIARGKK